MDRRASPSVFRLRPVLTTVLVVSTALNLFLAGKILFADPNWKFMPICTRFTGGMATLHIETSDAFRKVFSDGIRPVPYRFDGQGTLYVSLWTAWFDWRDREILQNYTHQATRHLLKTYGDELSLPPYQRHSDGDPWIECDLVRAVIEKRRRG